MKLELISCLLLLFLFLFFKSLFSFWLHLEIRDICRPGAGLAGTRDSMAQIRDIPRNLGRVATLVWKWCNRPKASLKLAPALVFCLPHLFSRAIAVAVHVSELFEALQWHIILWHTVQSDDRNGLETFSFCFPFHVFVFLYSSIFILFSFVGIFTFLFPFVLTDSLFFVNGCFRFR